MLSLSNDTHARYTSSIKVTGSTIYSSHGSWLSNRILPIFQGSHPHFVQNSMLDFARVNITQ